MQFLVTFTARRRRVEDQLLFAQVAGHEAVEVEADLAEALHAEQLAPVRLFADLVLGPGGSERLLQEFNTRGYLLRAYYYTALVEDQEYSSIRPLIDWLDYNGFTVVTKPAKEFTDAAGRRKIKGSMDIELTVDALEMSPHFDHFVLFSGDGDFTALVAALQRRGKRVTVASTLTTSTPMISDDLRRQADFFLDVAELAKTVGRTPPPERASMTERSASPASVDHR